MATYAFKLYKSLGDHRRAFTGAFTFEVADDLGAVKYVKTEYAAELRVADDAKLFREDVVIWDKGQS